MISIKRLVYFPSLRVAKALVLVLMSILLFETRSFSQEQRKESVPQNTINPVDVIDIIRSSFKKDAPARSQKVEEGVSNRSFLPIIGYGPANGFVIGAAVGMSKLLGNPQTTQLTSALLSISFTTKNQVLICGRSNIYLSGNKWYIPGDVRFLLFTQPTYGLGIYDLNKDHLFNIGGISVSRTTLEQPMAFNYVRIYESALREIFPHWYVGPGINFDIHTNIRDEYLKLDTPNVFITSNYFYSKKNGFDPTGYSTNGLSLNIIEDNRDNSINPYKGTYANISFRVNQTFLGSTKNSTMLYYEGRQFIPLQRRKPGHLLAFWTWGQFVTGGTVPYLALPSIGWDTYGRSGRGYVQGRLRGVNMMYAESEYRLPISSNGLIGAVAFVNVTTASNPITNQPLFGSFAPGYGVGLRIKMNKKDRTNICVDYGRGVSSSGIYFNIQETF